MRKVKFRNVKKLYDNNGQVLEPKSTQVPKGSYQIQGPAGETDETDCGALLTMESFDTERGNIERHLPSSKFGMKEEFRTCNVYATPHLCCMHSQQVASTMGAKTNDFSGACKGQHVSPGTSNDIDMFSPCACNVRHHTSSETSNLLSACSSRDSFSENVESKITLRASTASEDTGKKVAENHGFVRASIFHGDQIFLNGLKQQKESECFGDNISCISGSNNTNVMPCKHDGVTERKNTSCSLATVNSFLVIENPVNDQPASCYVPSSPSCEVENNCPRRTDKFTQESSQAIEVCSNKLDLSDISSLRVSFSDTISLKIEPSGCYEEQVESSLIRAATSSCAAQINDVHNCAECLKPDTEMSDRILEAEVVKCPVQKEDFRKSSAMVDESDIVKPPLQLQPVDHCRVSDALEIEVKVCDICGDAGREDLLANCSKCSDGAEHIYCMRVKLDKIPLGDWMCEECILHEENKRHMHDKFENEIARVSSQPSLNETMENSGHSSALDHNNHLKLSNKSSGDKNSRSKVKSSPYFSSKRTPGSLEAISLTKRTTFESIKQSGISRPSSKTCLTASFNKEKMKQTPEVTAPGDCLSDYTFTMHDKSHKLQPEYQKSQGSHSKPKSFKIMDSKVKVDPSEGGVLRKGFARETANGNNNKVIVTRMMKSKSLDNASSNHTDASDSKVVLGCSDFSHIEDLTRLKLEKEQSPTETECTSEFHNTVVSLPVVNSGVSVSMTDKNIANCGETAIPHTYGSNCRDLVDVQHHVNLDNLSKPASFCSRGSQNEEQNGVCNDAGQHILHSADMAVNIKSSNSNATLYSSKSPSPKDLPWFTSVAAISSWNSVIPQLSYVWKGQFDIQGGGRLPSSCVGIQAHVSTFASPKVCEVVPKLPQNILLEEVPRSINWPTQFLEKHATEENIALYFFASDVESYERNYKDFLDCLIRNDLSLKGNFDGVELLIFPSNLLPEKSQRWNELFFLWGVCRGRRVNCSLELPILQRTKCTCSRNEDLANQNQDLSEFPMSDQQNLCSCVQPRKSLFASTASYNVQQAFTLQEQHASLRKDETSRSEVFSTKHKVNFQTSPDCQQTSVCHAKNHLFIAVPHTDTSKKEERDSKGGQIIDISFQAGRERDMQSVRVDDEPKYKRFKSCFRAVDEFNDSRDMKYLYGLAKSFAGEDHTCGKAQDMLISSTNFSSTSDAMGFNSEKRQICLKDGSRYLEYGVLNLELSLGVEKISAEGRDMLPFGTGHCQQVTSDKKDADESVVPLSLSLALPEWHGVNTSLCL